MRKQFKVRIPLSAALATGLLASVTLGVASSATAAVVKLSRGSDNAIFNPDAPATPPTIPGITAPDTGDETPPPDYRAHSDVPDLPDGGDLPDPSIRAGASTYVPPIPPRIVDTFGLDSGAYVSGPSFDQPVVGSDSASAPSVLLVVPTPGTFVLFGAAGVAVAGRRRRR